MEKDHKMMRAVSSCIACLFWVASIAVVPAANWPGFRGPAADGVAATEKAPTHFGPTSNLLWKTEIPGGHSSPVIWNGQLFLTGADGNELRIICLDCASGKKRWEQSKLVTRLEPVHPNNSHATSTPVTDGKRLYAYFGSFGLLTYDLTGKELWSKPLPIPQTYFHQGSGTSPILAEDKLVVFVQVGNDSHLLAVNPANGEEIWQAPMPVHNNSYSTPVTWKEGDKGFVGLMCANRFTAFDLTAGKETWWVDGLAFQACGTPIVAQDSLIIAAGGVYGEMANLTPPAPFDEAVKKYGRDGLIVYDELPDDLLFINRQVSSGQGNLPLKTALARYYGVRPGAKLSREQWDGMRRKLEGVRSRPGNNAVVVSVRTGGKEDVTDSHVQWKETKAVPEVPSPLAWQGRLYFIRNGGILACRDLKTGKLIYEERIDSPGGYFASPLLVDGKIYVASDRGTVTVVKSGDAFEVLARNELGDPIIASPAVNRNILYIRSAGQLWAFADPVSGH